MRIDAYTNLNTGLNYGYNIYDIPEVENKPLDTPVEPVKPLSSDAFSVADVYEKGSSRPKVDFGGYNRFGRKTAVAQAEKLRNFGVDRSENYVISGVASILRTNSESLQGTMEKMGLSAEDMVNPTKAMSLTKNLESKYRIYEYSMKQRNLLKDEMNMNDSELDEFVGELKNAGTPATEE